MRKLQKWMLATMVACLIAVGASTMVHATEDGTWDLPLITVTGPYSGTWSWSVGGTVYNQNTVLQINQGYLGPNTLTGDGYLPWDWAGSSGGCWYGRNPTYPCNGILYPLTPPNPPAKCPTSYSDTLFLCLDRVPTHYICHVTLTGTFNVFIGVSPPLTQLNSMAAYPQEDFKQPCPDSIKATQFILNFTTDGTDCDRGFCNEDYNVSGSLGTAHVSGKLVYDGD